MASNESMDNVQTKADLEAQKHRVFQEMATMQLYQSQREVVNYLELGYLHLADHPDVAEEVRLTAHSARVRHTLTSGLMQRFSLTASQIVNDILPLVLEAVECRDVQLISVAFELVIECAKDMETASEKTRDSYVEIQTKIQTNISAVNKKNKDVTDKRKINEEERALEERMKKENKRKQKQLEEEKAQKDKEYEQLNKKSTEQLEDTPIFLATALGVSITPALYLSGPAGVIIGAINVMAYGWHRSRTEQLTKRVAEEKQNIDARLDKQRREAHQRVFKMAMLDLQQALLGNVESLRVALCHLANVDKQLQQISYFWNSTASVLSKMQNDIILGNKAYVKRLENPKLNDKFKKAVDVADKDWTNFGRICLDYVTESKTAIPELYGFLSAPIDNMSMHERAKRKGELLEMIKKDIDTAYGSNEIHEDDE